METEYMVATSGEPAFEKSPAVQTMEAFVEADKQGDKARAKSLLADDVVMLIKGKSLLAGEHRGPDAVLALTQQMADLSNNTRQIVATLAWLVHDNHIHTVVSETATRNGQTLHYNRALVFETRDGKIVSGQSFEDDQYSFDAFWS